MPESVSRNGRDSPIRTCPCCGLVQGVPSGPPGSGVYCARCGIRLNSRFETLRCNNRTAALAVAALVLYPFAVALPMLRVEQFGHLQESSVLDGVAGLFAAGDFIVGGVVLLCSIVLPLGKLVALLFLSASRVALPGHHRASTYRFVEWTGRWGMLDVLAVAVLVAALKLGNVMEVTAGPAAIAFACVVVLSLSATMTFDPHALWEPET